jgi:oligo-1,6-glucosidase
MKEPGAVYASGPRLHEFLQEMNRKVLSKYDAMTVGEAAGISLQQTPTLVDDRRGELNMIFNFDAVRLDRGEKSWSPFQLPHLKAIYTQHAKELDKHSWDTVFLANHDNPRLVSTFGDDAPEYRVASSKLLQTLLLTLRGTVFLYQGDELGMTNFHFERYEQMDDIAYKNAYKEMVATGKVPEAMFFGMVNHIARDHARTPMQWDATANAGFSPAGVKTWFAVNPNYPLINAASALADKDSIYHYTERKIALRHAHKALVYGDFEDLDPAQEHVFAYTRTLGEEKFLVVLNFGRAPQVYALPKGMKAGKLVESNLGNVPASEEHANELSLRPWEARVYRF